MFLVLLYNTSVIAVCEPCGVSCWSVVYCHYVYLQFLVNKMLLLSLLMMIMIMM